MKVQQLLDACKKGDKAIVEKLLLEGISVNVTGTVGYPPSWLLPEQGDLYVVTTPILHALAYGQIELAKHLLTVGANISHVTEEGFTAAHLAAFMQQENSLAWLYLQQGCNLQAQDNQKKDVIDAAKSGGVSVESALQFTNKVALMQIAKRLKDHDDGLCQAVMLRKKNPRLISNEEEHLTLIRYMVEFAGHDGIKIKPLLRYDFGDSAYDLATKEKYTYLLEYFDNYLTPKVIVPVVALPSVASTSAARFYTHNSDKVCFDNASVTKVTLDLDKLTFDQNPLIPTDVKEILKEKKISVDDMNEFNRQQESRMPKFQLLKDLVLSGQVTIYYELSLPRSNSTAWQIAITEAPEIDGQLNEPSFHSDHQARWCDNTASTTGTRSFDDYCGRILERIQGNKTKNKPNLFFTEKPDEGGMVRVSIVVNDLVHSVSLDELKLILRLTDKIAITIRDPLAQAHSALTRVVNDAISGPGSGNLTSAMVLQLVNKESFTLAEINGLVGTGKNKINSAAVLSSLSLPPNTELTSDLLVQAIKKAVERCANEYVEICWSNLKKQLATIRELAPEATLTIIDSEDLISNPEQVMKASSQALGLTYTPNMVNHWTKGTRKNFHCCITEGWGEAANTNAWNGPVRNSTRIERKESAITQTPTLSQFPEIMRDKLKAAIEIYDLVANSPERVHLDVTSVDASTSRPTQ